MGEFRRDGGNRGGNNRGGFGGRDGGQRESRGEAYGRDRGPVTMHQAVCDQCGKSCEVPFRPTEGKPIYCTVCFGGKKAGGDRGSEKFSPDKFKSYKTPSSNDFRGSTDKANGDDVKKQLETLNFKMDRLIKAVESLKNGEASGVIEKNEKTTKTAPVVKVDKVEKKAPVVVKTKKAIKTVPAVKAKKASKVVAILKAKKSVKKIAKKVKK